MKFRKFYTKIVLFITIMIIPLYAADTDWGSIRPMAAGLNSINDCAKNLINNLRTAVNTYGVSTIIAFTQTQNGGKGMSYTFNTHASYLLVKSGTFNVTTGLGNGKSFSYLLIVTDTAGTPNYKLKFYFNNINDIYGGETLTVVLPNYFTSSASSSYSQEILTYNDAGGNNSVKISNYDSNVGTTNGFNIRALVQLKGSTVEVSSLIYRYNSGDIPNNGYYTLAFIANTASPNNTIALQGAHATDDAPKDNGYTAVSLSVNRNNGKFNVSSGNGVYVGDQVSTDTTEYPAISSLTTLFTNMGTNAAFYNVSHQLNGAFMAPITDLGYPQ